MGIINPNCSLAIALMHIDPNYGFLVVFFFFFEKKIPIVVRDVCPSIRRAVRSSVFIISFRGNLISNRPIDLNIGLNVR